MGHFYTLDVSGEGAVKSGVFASEGVAFWVYPTPPNGDLAPTGAVELLRYWRPGNHFYTIAPENERGLDTYRREGAVCGEQKSAVDGALPVYRLLRGERHFYTISEAERDSAQPLGYTLEGVGFWAFPSDGPGRVPMYRFLEINKPEAEWYIGGPPLPPNEFE